MRRRRLARIVPEAWTDASPSETTPLWLALARAQAARRTPADLLRHYKADLFVAPSALDLRLAHRLDALALGAAHEYEALLLSPVAPLGSCSALAPTSQDRTLSAARGTEVVSDPTNVLALECARRLGLDPDREARLCTVHQTLRAQPLPRDKGYSRHFRLFALAEAGLARADHGFEVDAFARQVTCFERLFVALERELGCVVPRRRLVLRAATNREPLAARVEERLARDLPGLPLTREPFDSVYYDGVRVLFGGDASPGEFCLVGDLGLFDWMARLTSDRRMRFVASGFGLQLVPLLFR